MGKTRFNKPGAGRPSSYKPQYAQDLEKFFNVNPWKLTTRSVWDDKLGKLKKVKDQVPNDLPTLAGFCCKIGVHRETLLNWSKEHAEFYEALCMAKEHQERILVSNGLMGNYDKTFAIFTAKNLINWHDRHEVQHSGKITISDERKKEKLEKVRRYALVNSEN